MEGPIATEHTQVTCTFKTKLPADFRVPDTAVAVPVNLTRYGLSQIINGLLTLDPPRAFDFLLDGALLRTSLEQALVGKGTSVETILELEYTLAVLPPRLSKEVTHPDWVSAVDGKLERVILTGSYDGVVRVVDGNRQLGTEAVLATTKAHGGAITSVAALPQNHGPLALAASKDGLIHLWEIPVLSGAKRPVELLTTYTGHTDAVESVAVSPDGFNFCSGGWDTRVHLWRTGAEIAKAAKSSGALQAADGAKPAGKKRKVTAGGADTAAVPSAVQEAPIERLEGHSQCVSSVSWPVEDTLMSASWDYSVRKWSIETAQCSTVLQAKKAILCMAARPESTSLAAFGGADFALQIWDTRSSTTASSMEESKTAKVFNSHTDWVSGVAWHPNSEHHLATSSYDQTVKLWDLRSNIPLQTLQGHSDKVLSISWAGGGCIASGGADNAMKLYDVSV